MFKFLMRKGFGSIGETVRAILSPLKSLSPIQFTSAEDIFDIYAMLIGQRSSAAIMAGQARSNYLSKEPISKFFEKIEATFGPEEKFKMDVSIFVFLAIYLESANKRKGFREVSSRLRNASFEVIYEEAQKLCPQLILFKKEEYLIHINRLFVKWDGVYARMDKLFP